MCVDDGLFWRCLKQTKNTEVTRKKIVQQIEKLKLNKCPGRPGMVLNEFKYECAGFLHKSMQLLF